MYRHSHERSRHPVTSAQLIQEFQARWSEAQLHTHIAAAKILHEAQAQAFAQIAVALRANRPITEYEVQQFILGKINNDSAICSGSLPNCDNGEYASNGFGIICLRNFT